MLVGNYSRTTATGDQESGADDSGIFLVKGDVSGDESNKQIKWEDTKCLPRRFFGTQHESWTRLAGGGGLGVDMGDGNFLFPVEGTIKEGDPQKEGKTVSLLLYSKDTKNWTLSKGMSADGCGDPSVVEWEKDKLMMMTACDDGRRRVYEISDGGESWTEALGTLSRVWGNKKGVSGVRSGFITANFVFSVDDNRNVMLVTLPVYANDKGKGV
ncbi:trans-sialidase, putative, partial [Trypanosoma cruzi marinkellei]